MAGSDTVLLNAILKREYNPWVRFPEDPIGVLSNNISGIAGSDVTRDIEVWIAADIMSVPDRTSVVVVKHARLRSTRNGQDCVSSVYRVTQVLELGGTFSEQLETIQARIDLEVSFGNSVKVILDSTSVGTDLAFQWGLSLVNHDFLTNIRMVPGEGRRLHKRSVSDCLLTTRRAFQEGRVGIPSNPPGDQVFPIKRLRMQLEQRPVDFDKQGGLKAIDDRSSTMNHYSSTAALSCIVGQCEMVNAIS